MGILIILSSFYDLFKCFFCESYINGDMIQWSYFSTRNGVRDMLHAEFKDVSVACVYH